MENFTILLKKYADFIVRVGVNPQPGQTLVINCCLEAAPLARLCVRSAYEAGARDVLVNWSDNDVSRSRMELGSEEALSDFKSWQLRRYLDYAESEGGVCAVSYTHLDVYKRQSTIWKSTSSKSPTRPRRSVSRCW